MGIKQKRASDLTAVAIVRRYFFCIHSDRDDIAGVGSADDQLLQRVSRDVCAGLDVVIDLEQVQQSGDSHG